jgi:hypothetical protein
MASRLRDGLTQLQIPAETKIFLFSKKVQKICGQLSLIFKVYFSSFLLMKRSECVADHSPASSAEFKNEWSFTPPFNTPS